MAKETKTSGEQAKTQSKPARTLVNFLNANSVFAQRIARDQDPNTPSICFVNEEINNGGLSYTRGIQHTICTRQACEDYITDLKQRVAVARRSGLNVNYS